MHCSFRWLLCGWVALLGAGCKTLGKGGGDIDSLKPTMEKFLERMRWKDFRGLADMLVPEARAKFLKAREKLKDEQDLYLVEYQLQDATLEPEGTRADAVASLSWYRLPSTSVKSTTAHHFFVWRQGRWLLECLEEGPFDELVCPPPVVDAGTPP